MSTPFELPESFRAWVAAAAAGLDTGETSAADVVPQLAAAGLTGVGVAAPSGSGGDTFDAVRAIAAVARESLTAAFMLWGQRSYIEFLLQTANPQPKQHLPALLAGRIAGASGLSNAMKSLAGLEALQIRARADGDGFVLNGKLPWVTNLRPAGFHVAVAVAVEREDGAAPFIAFLTDADSGLTRSPDLDTMGMRSSDTASLAFADVRIGAERILAADAGQWLDELRPSFISLQCGLSIGLAARALDEAAARAAAGRGVLDDAIHAARERLALAESRLAAGLRQRRFEHDAPGLFNLRIELAEIVADAVALELQTTGGRAYLLSGGGDFARRWREAAFIPLVTPSLTQMRTALVQLRQAA